MDAPDANRLRIKWNKGRNYFLSFFSELEEVRKGMGNSTFARWCITELHLSVGIINNAANVLTKIDADVVKRTLAIAREEERRQKLREQKLKDAERLQRKEEQERIAEEKKAKEKLERKRKKDREYRRRKRRKLKEKSLSEARV